MTVNRNAHSPFSAEMMVIFLQLFLLMIGARTACGSEEAGTEKAGSSSSAGKITGGTAAPDGKYSFIARVERIDGEGGWIQHATGVCVILNRDWLLCFAHVFGGGRKDFKIEEYRMVVGDYYLNVTDEPYEQIVYPEYYIVHSGYDRFLDENQVLFYADIAVVKIAPPIKFSNRVTAVNLPESCDEAYENGTAWTVGWGYHGNGTGYFDYPNNELKEIQSPIISLEECRQRLNEPKISDLVICVKTVNQSGFCFGDKGAPLVMFKSESHSVVIGLASGRKYYGQPCDNDDQVEVYTNLAKYRGWIHRRISACGNNPTARIPDGKK